MAKIQIARTPEHRIEADVEPHDAGGFSLTSVTAVEGDPPLWEDLVGISFPEVFALRATLLSRMHALAAGRAQRTLLDRVVLSQTVYEKWHALARDHAARIDGMKPEDIPDEEAAVNPDGSLTIRVPLGESPIEMRVEPSEWSYGTH